MHNMKRIPLTKGFEAIVDDADFANVNQYKWHASKSGSDWYATRQIVWNGRKRKIRLHRFLLGLPPGRIPEVDHLNRNTMDNRRQNIHPISASENSQNRKKRADNNHTYKGVTFSKRRNCWVAQIRANGKTICSSGHATEIDAARAYDVLSNQYHPNGHNNGLVLPPVKYVNTGKILISISGKDVWIDVRLTK
jgi:AP2 domain